ncbi:MAG: hypothetical protein MUP66_01665 [Candidatus Nanohaloarchaeota archaeon QJJ-5]|nr:hypothetical protein [Candidatus Nanohaloarchaeota archaeon QJJ-5]
MDLTGGDKKRIKRYYSQDELIDRMVDLAAYREFAPTYPQGYGKRPDSITFPADFEQLVEKGAIAFHGSVERWKNPLRIEQADHDALRKGWDLVIDIDADEGMVYAKQAAKAIIDQLRKHKISEESISIKFSGNRGFHIGVPFCCFPDNIGGTPVAELYPRLPQAIVGYLRDRISDQLAETFASINPELQSQINEEGPFSIADVENDWGKRHLFRMPFSVNEKTIGSSTGMLVSQPIDLDAIDAFEKEDAHIDTVDLSQSFLADGIDNDARLLAGEAIDWESRQSRHEPEHPSTETDSTDYDYDRPDEALAKDYFPAPIKELFEGVEDGRKRGLFILITFLQQTGYDWEAVQEEIWAWNDRNDEALRDNYIKSQLQWHARQDEPLMPPNFSAKGWYEDIGVLDPDRDEQMLENFDNPVPYALMLRDKGEDGDGDDDDG